MRTEAQGPPEQAVLAVARQVLLESASLEETAPRLLRSLATVAGLDAGELWLVDTVRNVLTLEARWSLDPERPPPGAAASLGPGDGAAGRAWRAGRALALEERLEDAFGAPYQMALAAPFAGESGTLGALVLYGRERREAVGAAVLDALSDVAGQWGQQVARRRAEDALRDSEERYRTLVMSLAVGVLVEDASGAIETMNPAAESILGRRAAECTGRTVDTLGFRFFREDGSPLTSDERPAALALREGRSTVDSVVGVDLPDGRRRWISVNAEPFRRSGDGTAAAVLVSFVDVTDRRRLEEQLRQSQKMEALGQLAGSVAHDFNNLLTPILGYSEALQHRLPADSAIREDLEEIRRAGERAAMLTRQLLAFSRVQPAEPAVLDPNAVVTGLVKLLRHALGRDVELRLRLGTDIGSVRADPSLVEQVLMNLAVNARDAMQGSGTLTIETLDVELEEAYTRQHLGVAPGRYVLLAVSDTGSGIEPQVLPRIFEPFFTTKPAGRGTGLGLAIVYGILRRSGGHIGVYSEAGHGAVFKVYLPRADEPQTPAAPRRADRLVRGVGTVLLVEDEEGVRTFAARVLRESGYQVLEAANGEEALATAESFWSPIDLLLTDTVMPGLSGPELADALRRRLPGLRVVFMSGYTDPSGGGAAAIQKPFTPGLLTEHVRKALDAA